jgi:hypothetical protein
VIPTITSVSAMPNPVIQNNSLTFSAALSSELPKNYSVKVDYGNGLMAMSGKGQNYSVSKTLSKQGVQAFTVGVYDEKNVLKNKTSGEFEVIVPPPPENIAPILKKLTAPSSAILGENYEIELEASDFDNNLSSVLIDWGDGSSNPQPVSNGFASFSISHVYDTAGTFVWSAIATDKKDAQSELLTQKVTISKPAAKVPTISSISATPNSVITGNAVTFSATLSAALPSGFSVKVDYGNGLVSLSGSGTNYSVSKTPTKLGQQLFSIGIYDSKNVLQPNSSMTGNFSVSEPAVIKPPPVEEKPPVSSGKGDVETFVSGSKTFSYTKIANDGSELPKTAKLGTGAKDWACTKDNNTGLIWEVKTDDGGLRDWQKTYTNYDEIYPKCSGFSRCDSETGKLGDSTNTDGFVKAVNKQGLCGGKDWRLPEKKELEGLVVCSDGKYTNLGKDEYGYICTGNSNNVTTELPTINKTYFPDITENYWFWSSSPYSNFNYGAWDVSFGNGYSYYYGAKYGYNSVRLVR